MNELLAQFKNSINKYLKITEEKNMNTFPFDRQKGLVVAIDVLFMTWLNYVYKKATGIQTFLPKIMYINISEEKNDILYYTGHI